MFEISPTFLDKPSAGKSNFVHDRLRMETYFYANPIGVGISVKLFC